MAISSISGPFVGIARPQSLPQRLACRLYHATRRLDEAKQPTRCARTNPVTLVCVSDTHNTMPSSLPPGDILLHAGDLSQYGTFAEIQAQLCWLAKQPHPHKVVIAGNHDLLLDSAFVAEHPDRELERHAGQCRDDLDWGGVIYLERESIDVVVETKDRTIRVFGSPWTPRCGTWAFQYDEGNCQDDEAMSPTGTVPAKTDVLLVHGPPKGHLDDCGKGSTDLLAELWRARPKVVVCGHIHAAKGREWLRFDRVHDWFDKVMLGRRQWPCVLLLASHYVYLWLRVRVLGQKQDDAGKGGTHLVNAAMVGGRGNVDRREATVITL